ncbi:MAG: homoserine dehydrogenase [Candidatus Sumerlaea chitinivorans]|jgi:homoserine dehydrogenase|nr:homoserine dehydrogenase [Candidatus Sumerlaea chitinivorans]
MKEIKVGLIGFGNIGTGVVNALNQNGELIASRIGARLRLVRIADVDIKRKRAAEYDPGILTTDANEILNDPEIAVVIELVGGLEPARTFVEKALRNGKHVVTANKAMLANFGADLWRTAAECGVGLYFEASVGGGIPIIRALELGLSANNFHSIYGIVNGTCNYILTQMAEEHKAFDTVLAEAQAHGYAEPDPTFDIEGYDTAHKTAILASLAFQQDVRYTDVYVEGITRIRQVDIEYARELGYTIKLLGIAKRDPADGRVEVRVHPTLLPQTSLLAHVNGVYNGILAVGDLVGKTMFYGRGAGPAPTASAVLSDVMAAATAVAAGTKPAEHRLAAEPGVKNLKPIAELSTAYYLRLEAIDKPGVMAQLGGVLGAHNVSIGSMIQRGRHDSGRAEIIIVTHTAREKDVQDAIKEIAALPVTLEAPFVLRVEEDL